MAAEPEDAVAVKRWHTTGDSTSEGAHTLSAVASRMLAFRDPRKACGRRGSC